MRLTGSKRNIAVALNFAKSLFTDLNKAIVYGSYVQGVTVISSNFIVDYGVYWPTLTGTAQLSFIRNQCNTQLNACIYGNVVEPFVTGNLFILNSNTAAIQRKSNTAGYVISGNNIEGNGASDTTGILIDGENAENSGNISGNIFFNLSKGIYFSPTGTSISATPIISNTYG